MTFPVIDLWTEKHLGPAMLRIWAAPLSEFADPVDGDPQRLGRTLCRSWNICKCINNERLAKFVLVAMLDYYTERCGTC